jgi:urease alpha subunit
MIYLATPWRAFIGYPIKIPQTIKWARVRITPTDDGGASADIEAEDEDEATASEDAAYLTRTATALSQLNLGFLGSLLGQQSHKFIERVAFSAQGKQIHGEALVTADQLSTALDMAGAFLADRATRHVGGPRVVPSATH